MPLSRRFLLALSVSLAVPIGAKAAPTTTKTQTKNVAQLNNALIKAVEAGDVVQMEELLERGADPNTRDQRDYENPDRNDDIPVIFGAIKAKSLPALRLLVNKGANVNVRVDASDFRDSDGIITLFGSFGPLDYAVMLNQSEIVKLLVGAGAQTDPDEEIGAGQAYKVAAYYNALDSMRILLDVPEDGKKERAQIASSLIHWAATRQHPKMVQLLISEGADRKSCGGALAKALEDQDLDMAFALLDHADFSVVDFEGNTLLFNHIEQNWPNITEVRQLTFGVDPAKLTTEQRAELQEALEDIQKTRQRAADLIREMVSRGVNPNGIGRRGYTALMQSIDQGNLPFVQALLESGADPNYAPPHSHSPLRLLASTGNTGRLNTAIDNRTDGKITPKSRANMQARAEAEDMAIAKLLLAKGAKVRTGDGRYALGEAVARGNVALTKLLLENGADPNLAFAPRPYFLTPTERKDRGLTGQQATREESDTQKLFAKQPRPTLITPLMLAAANGHAEVVEALLATKANAKSRDSWGRNALHYLAAGGRAPKIRYWEQVAATLDDRNVQDSILTGLNLAEPLPAEQMRQLTQWVASGDSLICSALLSRGCTPSDADRNGRTPLQIALGRSALPVVDALLKATPKPPNSSAIFEVIQHGRRQERTSAALRKLQLDLIECDRIDMWYSLSGNNLGTLLKKSKAEAKAGRAKAVAQRTYLLRTWGETDAAVVSRLLARGANPNISNAAGLTPLMVAARSGQIEVVRALLKGGAKSSVKSRKGETVITQVEKYGMKSIKTLPMRETPRRESRNSEVWLQPQPIKAREQFIRHLLAVDDAALLQILKNPGQN